MLFLVDLNANINGLPLRPAVELMQRFDLDTDAVLVMPAKGNTYATAFPGESGVYGGEAGEQRLTAANSRTVRSRRAGRERR